MTRDQRGCGQKYLDGWRKYVSDAEKLSKVEAGRKGWDINHWHDITEVQTLLDHIEWQAELIARLKKGKKQ